MNRIIFLYLLFFTFLFSPLDIFAALGDISNPAKSCYHIKQENPSSTNGSYWLQNGSMPSAKQYYCNMDTNDGGWQLLFQRAGGTNNRDTCSGVQKNILNDFLHDGACGDVNNLAYGDSYNADDVDTTLADFPTAEYMNVQFNSSMTADIDDAFTIHTTSNLFPNSPANNVVVDIPVSKICDINNTNCDTTNGYWKYIGDSWFHSALCIAGNSANSSSYGGNYGYCHDGWNNQRANSLFGDRYAYNETKLYKYPYWQGKDYMERVFIRPTNHTPTDIVLSHTGVAHNAPIGTVIGSLTSTDVDTTDTHTYSFSCDIPGADDAKFSLSGSTLSIAEVADYDTQSSYTICIKATDNGIPSTENYDKNFTIDVGLPALQKLLINEVEYDPTGPESQSEWLELYNSGTGMIDIHNWTLTEKAGAGTNTYTFSGGSLSAGDFYVIVNDTTAFQAMYPGITPDLDLPGTAKLKLANSNDYLELRDAYGRLVDRVEWGNAGAGWGIDASGKPICRMNYPDTGTVADWSDECTATPGSTNTTNKYPTNITLSNSSIPENTTAIGNFTTTDVDTGDTHTYTLLAGTGSEDNSKFALSASGVLVFSTVPDFENPTDAGDTAGNNSYSIRVRTTDNGSPNFSFEKIFIITVTNANTAPTDISLSNTSIDENNAIGDLIGNLTATDDGEETSTLIYSLACAASQPDDGNFSISGSTLRAAQIYDYETKSSYNICIRVFDGGLSYDKNFTITIHDLDEIKPVIVLSAPTKLQNSSITDTTITVTDNVGINASDVSVGTGSTATYSSFTCTQSGATQVNCSMSIDASGDITILASDTSFNSQQEQETNYVIDTIDPNTPNVSVDTESPHTIHTPQVTFSSLDNVGIDYYTITYSADDGGAGAGTLTTLNPASSPVSLTLDPDEGVTHTIVVTVYDAAGNSSSTTVRFPPVITFSAPTTLSGTTIVDSTVTISTPTGNDIHNISLSGSTTGASLGTCIGNGGDTTSPYANPVTCEIDGISASGTIVLFAEDAVNGASGRNSQSYIIDAVKPTITIAAPTTSSSGVITNTTIAVTDDVKINAADVTVGTGTTLTSSSYSCVQTSVSRVDCTIQIDTSGNLQILAQDAAGNTENTFQNNYIIDTIAPTLSLIGPNPDTVEYQNVYTDPQANYSDNVDGTGTVLGVGSVNTGILGSYTLTYGYTDTVGNTASGITRTVNVVDTTAPVLSISGANPYTLEVGSTFTDPGINCSDNYDITCSASASGSVNTSLLGTYGITYSYTDTSGNAASGVTRTVNVVDTTDPVITLSGGMSMQVYIGSTFTDPGSSCSDNYDSLCGVNISGSVNTSATGSYTLTYSASDISGNAAIPLMRSVEVISGGSPILQLLGDAVVTIKVGETYTDAGATANDSEDGNISSNITATNPVNTSIIGSYTVRYNVADSHGNAASEISRTVQVIDDIAPIISLSRDSIPVLVGTTNYTLPEGNCSDNYDTTCTVTHAGTVDFNTVGSYLVTYTATDSSGNIATKTFTVDVQKRPSGGGSAPKYDKCDGNDTSGSIYDGKCSKEEPKTVKDKKEQKNQAETPKENKTEEKGEQNNTPKTQKPEEKSPETPKDNTTQKPVTNYTLTNNFASCQIVQDIKDQTYNSQDFLSFKDKTNINDLKLVEKFVNLGIVNGYEDDTFLPSREISRAEFLKFVLKSHCYAYQNEDTSTLKYTDVATDSWQAKVVSKAQNLGMIHGDIQEQSFILIPSFSGYIGNWSSKNEIQKLQQTLKQVGLYNGNTDGIYSPMLFDAVYAFQTSENLVKSKQDTGAGYWGIKTQKKFREKYSSQPASRKVFRPDDIISKIEALKILMRVSQIQSGENVKQEYNDIREDWHEKYVKNAQALKLYNAKKDNYIFSPSSGVQREEMLELISSLVQLYK